MEEQVRPAAEVHDIRVHICAVLDIGAKDDGFSVP